MQRLNLKAYITGLIKNAIKKLFGPRDVLFLILSAVFIGLSIFELSDTFFQAAYHHGKIAGYIFHIKYQMLFGFISVLLFLITVVLWFKQKLKSLLNYFIPMAKKNSFRLVWALLITAFALNSFFFILS